MVSAHKKQLGAWEIDRQKVYFIAFSLLFLFLCCCADLIARGEIC